MQLRLKRWLHAGLWLADQQSGTPGWNCRAEAVTSWAVGQLRWQPAWLKCVDSLAAGGWGESSCQVVRERGGEDVPPVSRGGLGFSRPASLTTPLPGPLWSRAALLSPSGVPPSLNQPPICWTSAAGPTLSLGADHSVGPLKTRIRPDFPWAPPASQGTENPQEEVKPTIITVSLQGAAGPLLFNGGVRRRRRRTNIRLV